MNSEVTNKMCEVHIQSFAVAKVRVHPTAVQNHLSHTFFYHLVVLRPVRSGNKAEQLDKKDMTDTNPTRLISHKWFFSPSQRSQNAMSKRVLQKKIGTPLNVVTCSPRHEISRLMATQNSSMWLSVCFKVTDGSQGYACPLS